MVFLRFPKPSPWFGVCAGFYPQNVPMEENKQGLPSNHYFAIFENPNRS
jgi:hypothetical protein